MESPVTFRPETAYQPYLRLAVLIIGVIIVAPTAILIMFVPDVAGRIALGIAAAVEVIALVLVDRWVPYYVRSLEYRVTGETVEYRGGVFWKRRVTVPFVKITNVDVTQGPVERRFGLGTVHVQTAGAGGAQGGRAELRISGIADIDRIRGLILTRIGVGTGDNDGTGGAVAMPRSGAAGETEALLGAILAELRAIRSLHSSGR